jgi:Ca-activated chloride channel family protein
MNSARCYNQSLMRKVLIGLIVLFTVSSTLPIADGQQKPTLPPTVQTTPQRNDDNTITVQVNLVNLLFTVADRKGKFVTNLSKDDFRVFEDDKLQSITSFSSETNLPLTIALLVDTSGSIRDKLRFEEEAAIEFFYSTLQRGKDRGLVIIFDSAVELIQDFTDDPEKLADKIRKIRAGGGTSLYDAVYLAVNEKLAGQDGRKIIIVITDGDDNSSRVSLTETLEAAQRNEVTIYPISTNSAAFLGKKEQERGDKTLKKFAEETGGKAFFPLKIEDLASSFLDIHDELRSQYQIAYRPTNANPDGTFRRIRVDVSDKRFKARAKTGYYMPKAAATSQR